MGAYAQDKNTSARLCAKNAGGAYARGGAYLQDNTVHSEHIQNMYNGYMYICIMDIYNRENLPFTH